MKKGLRRLTRNSNKADMDALMGGVNIGTNPQPLQPRHGRPETVRMPRLGNKPLPRFAASQNNLSGGRNAVAGKIKNGGPTIKNSNEAKKEMGKVNQGKVKWTDASDDRADKKAGIKEGSRTDRILDKKRGVPEDDTKKAPRKRRRLSAIAKATRAIKAKMKKTAPYHI